MRPLHLVMLFASLLIHSTTSYATEIESGRVVYQAWCSHCHDEGVGPHPGTQMLTITRGANRAIIKKNDTLAPEYIRIVVRQGLGMMPAFRKTELSDADLAALTDFLANASVKRDDQ